MNKAPALKNNGSILYKKFLGFLIKKGNKVAAKKILDETFFKVHKATKLPMQVCLSRLFTLLNSFVEVKKVNVRRRSILVPFSITLGRRSFLVVKWLMLSVKADKKKAPFSDKLSSEIINVLNDTNSKAKKLKETNIAQAMANRSNIHYRW